jgi:hypothetical protein
MTDIPDDIMQAANECVSEFRWNNDNRWHMFVARAILTERERSRQLLSEAGKREKEARAKALEEAAILADHHAGMARKEADELRNVKDYTRAAQLVSEVDALLALSHCLRALQSEER